MIFRRLKKAGLAVALVAFAACSDSTGSGTVSSEDALRSLSREFNGTGIALPFGMSASSLGGASALGQIDVTINNVPQRMYALGLRVTYPTGTCFESLFIVPPSLGIPSGTCSPPPLGMMLVLWQTRSGSRPPDRTILISADVGTTNFDFLSFAPNSVVFPAFALYIDGRGQELWGSISGTLTSQVTATNETCQAPPPPFALASTCNFATFDESGRIVFELFDVGTLPGGSSTIRRTELLIPRQNIVGILQAITAIKPIALPTLSAARGF
jgi:hypothetical protein